MPYYAIFATPLSNPFSLDWSGSEYSAELDAENAADAMAEAEKQFQPHVLAVHWYPTREKKLDEGRTVVDYEELEKEELRREEERVWDDE